jgi:hypothetical protein
VGRVGIMSRCKACDKILTSSEMFIREIPTEYGVLEVAEDMCLKCRKVVLDECEEDVGDMFLDYVEGDGDYYDEF